MSDRTTPAGFWEARYSDSDGVWSGRVNAALAQTVAQLTPGTALDLGCGEGGDVLWLAEQGWDATGIDISPTAVDRARAAATLQHVEAQTRFIAADLAEWTTTDRFDLVTASFLHSWPVLIPRDEILRRAAGFVAPGGHLLVIAHAAPMPGSDPHLLDDYRFPTPQSDLAALQLDPAEWVVVLAETREREVTSGEHAHAQVLDGVVLVQRR